MKRLSLLILFIAASVSAQNFMPVDFDEATGKVMLHINHLGDELIYVTSLPAGVGSNPIGLDRAQLGETRLVRFERTGPKVLLVEENTRFRALSNDANERRSVEDSFARSVIWGFKVEKSEGDGVVVDATDFFLSDQHGVAARLRAAQQGSYSVDKNRSTIYLPRTKSFPKNSEIESTLTFETKERPGPLVSGVTPMPELVTVREHFSFVQLPPPGYTPRALDPRVNFFGEQFADYASPFAAPLEKRWIARHRLQKKNPNAAVSDPVEPIVYYVDNGVPEPIRSALIEGASWWNQAFEAAGFRNAFQVRVLPDGADPMDIRYNMINWIHRSTRGWSMGEAVTDPRTGEIIKGNVLLGSLRIRQDVLIGNGLIPQYAELDDRALAAMDPKTSPSVMALARIRQLAAHETGHTLGLAHNMGASSHDRSSVMDYPAPLIKITNGKLDLSDAYAKGIGAYDIFAIKFGYSQFAPGANESAELEKIIRSSDIPFIKDEDARPVSAAHPLGSVWDSPGDPVSTLRHEMEVRRIALDQFGLRNLAVGEPLSSLEEILVPLYLHHRYQLEAAAKTIGGLYYNYSVKGKGSVFPGQVREVVPADKQRDAMTAVMSTLEPSFLQIPQRIIDVIPPRAFGYERGTAELFEHRTAPAFDPISAALSSADITLGALLDSHRAARMDEFHSENAKNPAFPELLDRLIDLETADGGAITRATSVLAANRLMDLANMRDADFQVRAEATEALRKMAAKLDASATDPSEIAHRHALREDIQRFLDRPDAPRTQPRAPEVPPGPPIGD